MYALLSEFSPYGKKYIRYHYPVLGGLKEMPGEAKVSQSQ